MKIVSVKQPWASAAVFGRAEVLNLRFQTRYRGPLLIHAAGVDLRAKADRVAWGRLINPYSNMQHAVIGIVDLHDVTTAGDCQLPFAVGPAVWLVGEPQVFPERVACPGFSKLQDVDDDELNQAAKNAISPRDYARFVQQHDHGVAPEQVHPRRRDGWVGD